jgi:hypothetical protein
MYACSEEPLSTLNKASSHLHQKKRKLMGIRKVAGLA